MTITIDELNGTLKEIINNKYQSIINKDRNDGPFNKMIFFEGNSVGQVGESFVKKSYIKIGIQPQNRDNTHDEYDVLVNGVKIEVKTACLGSNNTFQFNGINPAYNSKYIILLGISDYKLYYHIIKKDEEIKYVHESRGYYCKVKDDKRLKLAQMNPGNEVNYKLTMNVKYLRELDDEYIALLKKLADSSF